MIREARWKPVSGVNYSTDWVTFQHVDEEAAYLCGYLKIKNLTDEYPEMVTFFDGEIISEKHPFLTRKWDADEDVDKKHWVEASVTQFPETIRIIF